MNLEQDFFSKTQVDFDTLLTFGFQLNNNKYVYEKNFMNHFKAVITITEKGKINGCVYDLDFNEEYNNFRIAEQVGEFSSKVKEVYLEILNTIKEKCCKKRTFATEQACRISDYCLKKYDDLPEFLLENTPDAAVFRNPINKKWYGLIMYIDRKKLGEGNGATAILNIKLDKEEIISCLKKKGYYKAYHMNKENWLTVTLDDTLKDEEIEKLIDCSHEFTEHKDSWVIPANLKYYDIIEAFKQNKIIEWHQDANMNKNDFVYIYLTAPYQTIAYKCQIIEANILDDENQKRMKLELLEVYPFDKYSIDKLKELGLKSVRGARKVPERVIQYLSRT